MWNRWAALPRGIRWPVGIAAVVLAAAIVWALFVPVADWLAHHDVGSVKGSLHETALDNARGRLLTLGAGLFAAGALWFTGRSFTLSREGQVTDRYTKAIEQLGSDKLDVRLGGIYALERIASDSARDHPTVMEVLTAFVREHSREHFLEDTRRPRPPPDPGGREQERSTRPDVQAAVTVVGRRDAKRDIRLRPIDLRGAVLVDAHLEDAKLARADLRGAVLAGAKLTGAKLTDADLDGADLRDAVLTGAKLDGADLTDAKLTDAKLDGADLVSAVLLGADLTFADLAGADLASAWWSANTPVPDGWERDINPHRLKRAGTGPKPAGAN